jgi:hypothetical protein
MRLILGVWKERVVLLSANLDHDWDRINYVASLIHRELGQLIRVASKVASDKQLLVERERQRL